MVPNPSVTFSEVIREVLVSGPSKHKPPPLLARRDRGAAVGPVYIVSVPSMAQGGPDHRARRCRAEQFSEPLRFREMCFDSTEYSFLTGEFPGDCL